MNSTARGAYPDPVWSDGADIAHTGPTFVPDVIPDLVWSDETCVWLPADGDAAGSWRITQPPDRDDPADADTWTGRVIDEAPGRLVIRWDHGEIETRTDNAGTGLEITRHPVDI